MAEGQTLKVYNWDLQVVRIVKLTIYCGAKVVSNIGEDHSS